MGVFLKRVQVHSDRFTEMVQISLINCLLFLNISVLSVIWLYTKNLFFLNTTKKQSMFLIFKTTYLISKVIVPKHKNREGNVTGVLRCLQLSRPRHTSPLHNLVPQGCLRPRPFGCSV